MWSFLLLVICIQSSFSQKSSKYCPSTDWTLCGKGGDNCIIEPGVTTATISFGVNVDGENPLSTFLFWDITNNHSNQQFKMPCGTTFGDPLPNTQKGCCFIPSLQSNINDTNNENEWIQIAKSGEKFSTNNKPIYTRFGANGQYIYRWISGSDVACNSNNYPDVSPGNTKYCYKNPHVNISYMAQSTFVPCGSNKGGGECNTNLVINGADMALIQYGVAPNWVYSYAYSSNMEVYSYT